MIIRDVEVSGRAGLDVRLEAGRIAEIAPRLPAPGDAIDGRGGSLIPGLADHHIHLLGLAAQADSTDVSQARSRSEFEMRVREALAARPHGGWVRITGYHESLAGDLTRVELDAIAPAHRLRVQHQTGALWVLNSRALESLGPEKPPELAERDPRGRLTGRIWRGDAWLRGRIGAEPPPLAPVGRQLARYGVTALTDASVTTDATAAAVLAEAHRAGELPQRLTLMSGGELNAPPDCAFAVGPLKVLLDEHDLPDLETFVGRIACARRWDRPVAVHCVTATELALTLAAFEGAGAKPGDRIEHGGVIPEGAIGQIRRMGLTVVTQPAFISERGDRYAADVPHEEQTDLYRCATLLQAGVRVAGSSDAPYASPDPWAGMAAATDRTTAGGRVLGEIERVPSLQALRLYLGGPADPGGPSRRVAVGEPADLCLLKVPLADALAAPDADLVAATFIGGRPVWIA